mmetsp:Transcript_67558/g.178173  ORF Transcript_67558/g.178173 Transcript_67558/m.178173 type:complete len:242 (+) Transcript_67558:717-1442(+)
MNIVRIAPELRYPTLPLEGGGQRPYGYVGSSSREGGTPKAGVGKRVAPRAALARPPLTVSGRTLQLLGSGVVLAPAAHPLLASFIVVPYGAVHTCARRTLLRKRPLLLSFWGCGSAPNPTRSKASPGPLWEEREALLQVLATSSRKLAATGSARRHKVGVNAAVAQERDGGLQQSDVRVVDTCASASRPTTAPRRFNVSNAQHDYKRSKFCISPPGSSDQSALRSHVWSLLLLTCVCCSPA